MALYRKKPVTIEAVQLTPETMQAVVPWCGGMLVGHEVTDPPVTLVIPTLEGPMSGRMGDWIICGVQGEFYPVKPEIFEATYEAVTLWPFSCCEHCGCFSEDRTGHDAGCGHDDCPGSREIA